MGAAIAVPSHQPVAVEDAGYQLVIGNVGQLAHGFNYFVLGGVARSPTALRQPQFRMDAIDPMDQENNLGGGGGEIGKYLMNDSAHDALLEPGIDG